MYDENNIFAKILQGNTMINPRTPVLVGSGQVTQKINNPSEAKIKSHQLMLRVGMIKQSSAGIYSWLPLGFKVMKKIEQIVREEQNNIGAQEILMPTIQSSEIWKESGRLSLIHI